LNARAFGALTAAAAFLEWRSGVWRRRLTRRRAIELGGDQRLLVRESYVRWSRHVWLVKKPSMLLRVAFVAWRSWLCGATKNWSPRRVEVHLPPKRSEPGTTERHTPQRRRASPAPRDEEVAMPAMGSRRPPPVEAEAAMPGMASWRPPPGDADASMPARGWRRPPPGESEPPVPAPALRRPQLAEGQAPMPVAASQRPQPIETEAPMRVSTAQCPPIEESERRRAFHEFSRPRAVL